MWPGLNLFNISVFKTNFLLLISCAVNLSRLHDKFLVVVLGGAFRLVLWFGIFSGYACDYLWMNFTISPFNQRVIPYLIYHAMLILCNVYSMKSLYDL